MGEIQEGTVVGSTGGIAHPMALRGLRIPCLVMSVAEVLLAGHGSHTVECLSSNIIQMLQQSYVAAALGHKNSLPGRETPPIAAAAPFALRQRASLPSSPKTDASI